MKILIGAIAFALAVPAVAQAAPAADPKPGHADHHSMDQGGHQQDKHDCMECCEKMMKQHGKMEGMNKKDEPKASEPSPDQEGHVH